MRRRPGLISAGGAINQSCGLAQGLVGFWMATPQTAGGGLLTDLTQYSRNGTLTNGPTWVGSPYGPAVSFDGVNDCVVLPLRTDGPWTTTGASLLVVLRLNSATPATAGKTGFVRLTSNSGTAQSCHYPWTDGVGYINTLQTSRSTITLSSDVTRTEWHSVGITSKSGANGWSFLQNGIVVVTNSNGQDSITLDTSVDPPEGAALIGRSENTHPTTYALDGHVAYVLLWNIPLPTDYFPRLDSEWRQGFPTLLNRRRTFASFAGAAAATAYPWHYYQQQHAMMQAG